MVSFKFALHIVSRIQRMALFTKADISKCANSKAYQRGSSIFELGSSIEAKRIVHLEDVVEIRGNVQSMSGWSDHFRSCIITDKDMDAIEDYECTCPAALRFHTMCKHCVALGLDFLSDPDSFNGFERERVPKSSRSILRFLEENPLYIDSDIKGKIGLEVELTHDFGKWSIRVRIGADGSSCIIQNLGAFANALKTRSFLEHGKKVAFVHDIEAFDPESRKIANFLVNAIDTRTEISSNDERIGVSKSITLSESEVVLLLDLIGNSIFRFIDLSRSNELFNMKMTDADPDISLRIVEDDRGFYIIRDDDFTIANSSEGTYIFMDGIVYRCSDSFSKCGYFLENVYLSDDDELFISKQDAARFCAKALPLLESSIKISIPGSLEALRPVDGKISYYFDLIRIDGEEFITADIRVAYGENEFYLAGASPLEDPDGKDDGGISPLRDDLLENEAVEELLDFFDMSLQLPLKDEEKVGTFLYEGLRSLESKATVYTTPAFDRLISLKDPHVQIGLSIDGNLLNMDISPTDLEKEELAQLLGSYRKKRHFHRLKNGAIIPLEDSQLIELSKLTEELGLTLTDIRKGRVQLPAYRAFLLDIDHDDFDPDNSFMEFIDSFNTVDQDRFIVPKGLKNVLRGYQIEGFKWFATLSELGFGGILADEMGLGKTIQVITLLQYMHDNGKLDEPVLIVCPASLVYNWLEEFSRYAPDLDVIPVEGLKIERNRIRRESKGKILLASYDMIRSDCAEFEKMRFSYLILDEAQYIKNHTTKTTRAIKRLTASHRFALTGTPIENRLSEIWSIYDFLMPNFLGTYAYFMQKYESEILGGDEDTANRLQALLAPFLLRRLKDDVLSELPDKMESVIYVQLKEEQRKLYDANEQELRETLNLQKRVNASREHRKNGRRQSDRNRIEVLAEITRLREIALDPSLVYEDYKGGSAKIDVIFELLDQAIDGGKKTLIFSQFTSYLDILKERLTKEGIAFHVITGSTKKRERLDLVNSFNSDDVPVFLVSLKAGGTGLNLIGASNVIHADPWWNAAAINQATDRAHRIGQTNEVNVYKLIAKGTIEERIEILQEKKTELADSIVKKVDAISLASLTKDELEYLLFD